MRGLKCCLMSRRTSRFSYLARILAAGSCLAATLPLQVLASEANGEPSDNQGSVTNRVRPHKALLLDSMGRLVAIPTNEVSNPALLPSTGLDRQIPMPVPGASTPPEIQERKAASREGQVEPRLFPPDQPPLMPYLASQDEFGNTAARPGPLLPTMPVEPWVQGAKYWLSDHGLRYSLKQTVTYATMTDVMKGDNTLGFYTFDFQGKWAVVDAPANGTAGWISTHIEAKSGLGTAGQTQDARHNLGSTTDPTGIWSSVNGLRIPELAWQQSLRNGEVVVVAGMLNQGNYLDANAYAGSGRGQFINSALIDTMVVPLANYNFGLNLQWQPTEHWYGILGNSVGNGHAGSPPWTDFSWENWNLVAEVGYIDSDFLGLGPGIYRVQPFVGQPGGGPVETGFGLNFQQQLGRASPFGWFGRFGTGGKERFSTGEEQPNTGSQVGTGFVMQAPLKYVGLVPRLSNDLFGTGFVWSHSNESSKPIYHPDEYVFETFYTLQLAPMMRLQPDFQVVWNPTHNPDSGPALVGQIQLILAW
jgi:porin